MNKADKHWIDVIKSRFSDREDLNRNDLYKIYYAPQGLPYSEVMESLDLIEEEYEINAGLLRPDDRFEKLYEPVETSNPWKLLVYRVREGDSQSEIDYQLDIRLKQFGIREDWLDIRTVGEYVRAWCGLLPAPVPDRGK